MIKKLLQDISLYLPAKVIPAIVGFISIPVITRLFSPEDYGNYALVMATINILVLLMGWLSMSVLRFYPAYEKNNKSIEFSSSIMKLFLIFTAIIFILTLATTYLLEGYMGHQLSYLARVGAVVFVIYSMFTILQSFLRTKRIVLWYSGFESWKSVVSLVVGLILVTHFNFRVDGLFYGMIISLLFVLPFLWKKAIGRFQFVGWPSLAITLESARYGVPLLIANLSAWILSLSDRYILEFFRGSAEVGIYSVSYGIAEKSVMLVVSLILLADKPLSYEIWEKNGLEISRQYINKLVRLFLLICVPAACGLIILAKPLVELLVPSDYIAGYRIILYVAMGAVFLGLQQIYQKGFIFHRKTGFIMLAILSAGVFNLALNFLFIPKFGYMAAAVTTLVSYIALCFFMAIGSKKIFKWDFPKKSLARVAISSLFMGLGVKSLIVYELFNWGGFELIPYSIFGIAIYLFSIYFLGEIKRQELQSIKSLFFK